MFYIEAMHKSKQAEKEQLGQCIQAILLGIAGMFGANPSK